MTASGESGRGVSGRMEMTTYEAWVCPTIGCGHRQLEPPDPMWGRSCPRCEIGTMQVMEMTGGPFSDETEEERERRIAYRDYGEHHWER